MLRKECDQNRHIFVQLLSCCTFILKIDNQEFAQQQGVPLPAAVHTALAVIPDR